MIPALLKWIGNKQRFANTIVSYMPHQFNDYYEPFLGSGAVMAELLYCNRNTLFPNFNVAYGSDILPFLIDIFKITKENPEILINHYRKEILEYYRDSNNKYDEILKRFNDMHNPFDFCLLSRTCYSGIIRFRKNDGYMSTPKGIHKPISPETFEKRVQQWNIILQDVNLSCANYIDVMDKPKNGDLVYCDPPYTNSQSIIYGAQNFHINVLLKKIQECKNRGVKVMLSLNGIKNSKEKNFFYDLPIGLFERKMIINCGTSMIDRLQNFGKKMKDKKVEDQLLLTW